MNAKTILSALAISLLLFVPFLGYVHLFDWDEINFAECAREMVMSGDYSTVTIDYAPFWEKPPLFIWMQAFAMKLFGVNAFAARFPNVLAAFATILTLIYHGRKHQSRSFAYWWVLCYLGSFLPNVYFHSGIIDPWFNLFIFNALAFYYLGTTARQFKDFLLAGLFAGLAVMTKGPAALLLVGASLFLYHALTRFATFPRLKFIALVVATTLVISLLWFIMLGLTGNQAIISQFIAYQARLFQTQDAGHGGPIYYHWVVLLLGCFPASFFALGSLAKRKIFADKFTLLVFLSGMFTLVLFSVVQTKIIHYSSFCYFFITYFAALTLTQFKGSLAAALRANLIYVFVVIAALGTLVYLQIFGGGITKYIPINDAFALANLKAKVAWQVWDFAVVLIWALGLIMALYFLIKQRTHHAAVPLFLAIPLGIISMKATVLPHVENYTQGAAIEFYEKHRDQNVYLITLGFKSYAHLFYGEIKPHTNPLRYNEPWVCSDSTDLPAFYVARYPSHERYLQAYPNLKMLYMKNGFVFLAQKKNLSLKIKHP
jgi:4-amino-4-deoxy-L-arabinose transferase-like glycosyltransferase